ncbi:MAG: hypothetical protein IH957_11080 [Chloroflexi bacterium]|nr:hypothetical protein [Chloroflexota bacterium]
MTARGRSRGACPERSRRVDELLRERGIWLWITPPQHPRRPTLGGALPAVPAGDPPSQFGDVDCDDDVDSLKILRSVAAFSVSQNESCTNIGDPF